MSAAFQLGFGSEIKKQLKGAGITIALMLLRFLIKYLLDNGGGEPDDGAGAE